MKVDSEGRTQCNGTDCLNLALGTLNDVVPVPRWRQPNERARNFELLGTHNYCVKHEQAAKHSRISRLCNIHLL